MNAKKDSLLTWNAALCHYVRVSLPINRGLWKESINSSLTSPFALSARFAEGLEAQAPPEGGPLRRIVYTPALCRGCAMKS